MNRFTKRFYRIFFSLSLAWVLCGFNFYDQEYEGIRETTARIVEANPVSKSYYIGLGRSPTPIVAFMRAIGIQNVRQLPLSQMMIYPQMKAMREGVEDLMTQHLSENLPTVQELAGKRVVLIDFSVKGGSIIESAKAIRKFYGSKVQVDAIALMKSDLTTKEKDLLAHGKVMILPLSEKSIFYQTLLGQRYDRAAPIQQKLIWNTWSKMDPVDESEVADFQRKLLKKIESDPHANKIARQGWNICRRLLLF